MTFSARNYAPLALALSASLLIGAWIFQYGFGYAPCQMCYWQRHAHKGVIAVCVLVIIWQLAKGEGMRVGARNLGTGLIMLAFLVSAFFALWHTGVELGFIEALPSCSGGDVDVGAIKDMDVLGSLGGNIKLPACSEVPWSLFGISMAGYNAIFSLLGAAMGMFALRGPRP